jgi:hypothetical protein
VGALSHFEYRPQNTEHRWHGPQNRGGGNGVPSNAVSFCIPNSYLGE